MYIEHRKSYFTLNLLLFRAFRIFILSGNYKEYNELQCGTVEIYIVASREKFTLNKFINPVL